LFFVHLMACVVYGVLVAGYELGALWRSWPRPSGRALARLVIAGAPFLPPLALLLLAVEAAGMGAIHYGRLDRKLDLLFSVFDNYDRIFDIICFASLVLAAGVAYVRHYLVVIPALRLPLVLLGIVYLAAPSQLMTASAVDHRLPLVMAAVLAAGTSVSAPTSRLIRLAAFAGLALFLARMTEVWVHWGEADAVYARLLPILDQVPRGGRLAVGHPPEAVGSSPIPTTHLPALAIVRRDAFVPTLFAFRGQQPVALTPEGERLAGLAQPSALWLALMSRNADRADIPPALREFDAVLLLDRRPFATKPIAGLVPLAAEPGFALYRVER